MAPDESSSDEVRRIRARLMSLETERRTLKARLSVIEKQDRTESSGASFSTKVTGASPPNEKIALFRSLFRGREDVYPRRWENARTGRVGYAPVCANEWKPKLCG